MRTGISFTLVSFFAVGIALSGAAQAVLIDDFSVVNTAAEFDAGFAGAASAVGFGGGRDGAVFLPGSSGPVDIGDTTAGVLTMVFNATDGVFVTYEGAGVGDQDAATFPDPAAPGLSPLQNFAGGTFTLDVTSISGGSFEWLVALADAEGDGAISSFVTLGVGVNSINLSGLTPVELGPFNPAQIREIGFQITRVTGLGEETLVADSFEINLVPPNRRASPSPSSVYCRWGSSRGGSMEDAFRFRVRR